MRKFIRLAVFILFIGMAIGQTTKTTPDIKHWERIGLKKVGQKSEFDSFKVGKDKFYKFIKINVYGTGIIIERWILEYRNGSVQHISFVGFAPAEKGYPPIPVNGRLKKIHFQYYSIKGNKDSSMEVLGNK